MGYVAYYVLAGKPAITSVEHVDDLTGTLKFAPNQYKGYKVQQYSIHTNLRNSSRWVKNHTEQLQGIDEKTVSIPLHLVGEASVCEYQVAMHYLDVTHPVWSEVHEERLEPTGNHSLNMMCTGPVKSIKGVGRGMCAPKRGHGSLCHARLSS